MTGNANHFLIITLNVNGLNSSIKRHRLAALERWSSHCPSAGELEWSSRGPRKLRRLVPKGENGALDHSLLEEADQAEGSPSLSEARLQATKASSSSGDVCRFTGSFELFTVCSSISRRVENKCL